MGCFNNMSLCCISNKQQPLSSLTYNEVLQALIEETEVLYMSLCASHNMKRENIPGVSL